MSDESRVKRWRQNKRQHGLKALTIWVTTEEELRLKDLAMQGHCSPSQIVQRALAQYPGAAEHSSPADTSLIRQLIRDELRAMQAAEPPVSVGNTVGHTDTSTPETPAPTTPASAYDAPHGHSLVTEALPGPPQVPATALEAQICTWLHEHPEGESVKGLVAVLGVSENAVRLRMNALVKSGQIQMHGAGRTLRYFLVEDADGEGVSVGEGD